MKRLIALMICLVVMPVSAETPEPDANGWLHLFNGKDLSGWEIWENKSDFKVQDGVIRCEHGGGGQFMLYKEREFSDFELVVEWRVSPKGNSGIFIRSPFAQWPWELAYEVQISNEQPPRDEAHCTGSIYGYAEVNPRPDETPEKWRTTTIRAVGGHITVAVDGQQVVDYDESKSERAKDKPRKGWVGVQDSHAGEPNTWIEYRVIKVREVE